MKILSSFCFLVLFCLLSFFAEAKTVNNLKWTTENFKALNENDKKKFVQEIRQVIVLLDEKSDFFTELNFKIPNAFSWAGTFLLQQCLAADPAETYFAEAKIKVKVYKTDSYVEASQMAYKEFIEVNKSNAGQQLSELESERAKTALVFLAAEAKRLENSNDDQARKILAGQFKTLSEKIGQYKLDDSSRRTVNGIDAVFYKINKTPNPNQSNDGLKNKISDQMVDDQNKEIKNKNKRSKSKENEKNKISDAELKKIDSEYAFSACLYAGFVIEEKVCRPPKVLPKDNFLIAILDEKTFKCETSEEIICNPMLFGYEGECGDVAPKTAKEAAEYIRKDSFIYKKQKEDDLKKCLKTVKPVCVPNSISATIACEKKTKNGNYLKKAVDILSANPEMIQDYIKNLTQLCDKDQMGQNRLIYRKGNGEIRRNSASIKKDIQNTCAVAKPMLDEVLIKYRAIKYDIAPPGQKAISVERTGSAK